MCCTCSLSPDHRYDELGSVLNEKGRYNKTINSNLKLKQISGHSFLYVLFPS